MPNQTWNPKLYDSRHSFVWKGGEGLLELLQPRAGERILDLGCGTGHLTRRIAESGAKTIGVDNSEEMIAAALKAYPAMEFYRMDALSLKFPIPFDAIFTNAVLHWIRPPEDAVRSMRSVLKKDGRLVLEMGGKNNVRTILEAMRQSLAEMDPTAPPMEQGNFFPSVAEYSAMLEANGFEVVFARLFDRQTPLEGGDDGLRAWIRMFRNGVVESLPLPRREEFFHRVETLARKRLNTISGWVADYRRLQVIARAV